MRCCNVFLVGNVIGSAVDSPQNVDVIISQSVSSRQYSTIIALRIYAEPGSP